MIHSVPGADSPDNSDYDELPIRKNLVSKSVDNLLPMKKGGQAPKAHVERLDSGNSDYDEIPVRKALVNQISVNSDYDEPELETNLSNEIVLIIYFLIGKFLEEITIQTKHFSPNKQKQNPIRVRSGLLLAENGGL